MYYNEAILIYITSFLFLGNLIVTIMDTEGNSYVRNNTISHKEFETVGRIVKYLSTALNVINSTDWTLRRSAERFASFTKFGNVAVHSTLRTAAQR